jgi:hypothetical protein
MSTLELLFFGFTLWLGAYLLARDSQKITVHLRAGACHSNHLQPIYSHRLFAPALWRLSAHKETDTVL